MEPEQIAGRFKLAGNSISHETIYRHIWKDKSFGGTFYKHLRHSGKKYNKRFSVTAGRGYIPNRVDIDERPKIVEQKTRIGDWEGGMFQDSCRLDRLVTLHHWV